MKKAFMTLITSLTLMLLPATTVLAQTTSSQSADGIEFWLGMLFCCVGCCIWPLSLLILSYLVYRDAKKLGIDNAALWAVVVWISGGPGALVYYLVARRNRG